MCVKIYIYIYNINIFIDGNVIGVERRFRRRFALNTYKYTIIMVLYLICDDNNILNKFTHIIVWYNILGYNINAIVDKKY